MAEGGVRYLHMRNKIQEYLKKRKWDEFNPTDLAKSTIVEAAELLELFQWGQKTRAEYINDKDFVRKVRHEVADVVIDIDQLANRLGFTLEEAVEEKLDFLEKKYPVDEVLKGNADKIHWDHRN